MKVPVTVVGFRFVPPPGQPPQQRGTVHSLAQRAITSREPERWGSAGEPWIKLHLFCTSELLACFPACIPCPRVQPPQPLGFQEAEEPAPDFFCPSLCPGHAASRVGITVRTTLLPPFILHSRNQVCKCWFRCSHSPGRTPTTKKLTLWINHWKTRATLSRPMEGWNCKLWT